MAKWSVALFGHHKPHFELREKRLSKIKQIIAHGYHGEPYYYLASSFTEKGRGYDGTGYHEMTKDKNLAGMIEINRTVSRHVEMPTDFDTEKYFVYNVLGWEKRVEPTDIIAYKSYRMQKGIVGYSKFHEYGKDVWTEKERKEFLLITLDNLEYGQMAGICEPLWDTNSYKIYDPLSFQDWETMMIHKINQGSNVQQGLYIFNLKKDEWYQEYIDTEKEICAYPSDHLRKRRFCIPMNDLKILGVDEIKMLDKAIEYVPDMRDIQKIESYDKLKNRYTLESDGFNLIKPLIYGGKI